MRCQLLFIFTIPVNSSYKVINLLLQFSFVSTSLICYYCQIYYISICYMTNNAIYVSIYLYLYVYVYSSLLGFPGSSDGKNLPAWNAGDSGSISGSANVLEKEMETHSSILAWRIPWTEELGRLQSMGSQSVRTEWLNNSKQQSTVIYCCPTK